MRRPRRKGQSGKRGRSELSPEEPQHWMEDATTEAEKESSEREEQNHQSAVSEYQHHTWNLSKLNMALAAIVRTIAIRKQHSDKILKGRERLLTGI